MCFLRATSQYPIDLYLACSYYLSKVNAVKLFKLF